jgi:hypothetical protein
MVATFALYRINIRITRENLPKLTLNSAQQLFPRDFFAPVLELLENVLGKPKQPPSLRPETVFEVIAESIPLF